MVRLLNQPTYTSVRDQVHAGDLRCLELTEKFLIKTDEGADLNAFISVFRESALKKAESVDKKIRARQSGSLAGMVMAIKGNMAMAGKQLTCGSKILDNFVSPYNATVVQRLLNEDAVIIGSTNMDEFGMGSTNENSAFGAVRNPVDQTRVPGGSSGGSAAAVAAGLCMTALGSDTGGSVRQPAAFCGLVGLRPTYGRVSRYGLVSFASSFDQVGVLTHTVDDCASVFQTIAGYDEKDSTSIDRPVPEVLYTSQMLSQKIKIGMLESGNQYLDSAIAESVQRVSTLFCEDGVECESVNLPWIDVGIATYYLSANAEAASNLARYDGLRYGQRVDTRGSVKSILEHNRTKGFGPEVKRRIMLGTYALSKGYYNRVYQKAQDVRGLIRTSFTKLFSKYDVLIGPTTPTTAPLLGEMVNDPLKMYLSDIFTVMAPLAGLPAVSVPFGKDENGLPIGIQITGDRFEEKKILNVARWLEANSAS